MGLHTFIGQYPFQTETATDSLETYFLSSFTDAQKGDTTFPKIAECS